MKSLASAPGERLGALRHWGTTKRGTQDAGFASSPRKKFPSNARSAIGNRQLILLSLLAALLFLAGCGRSGPSAGLVIINGAEPESLDPAVLTGEADGRAALELFAGLTRYNPTNAAPVPDLAEGWDISPDGKIYTFHLRS